MREIAKKQPFFPFKDLSTRFSDKHLNSPFRRWLLKSALAAWNHFYGIEKYESLITQDLISGDDGFAHDQWIFKSIFYPEISCSFLLDKLPTAKMWLQAAWLIHGGLIFRQQALNGTIEQEYEADIPLDMSRYRLFFSRWTDSQLKNGRPLHIIKDSTPSDFVILAIESNFYKLQVLDNGQPISIEETAANIEYLCEKHMRETKPAFGALATLCNKKSVHLISKLNNEELEAMNEALFLVAIDLEADSKTPDEMLRSIHSDHFANRDYRRSMQMVLNKNGVAGILVNPHAGLGGTLSARFCAELTKHCKNFSTHEYIPPKNIRTLWKALPLALPNDHDAKKALQQIQSEILSRLYPKGKSSTFVMHGIGAQKFRAEDWSPDAVFHAALNLAYFRYYGRMPVVGNFINLRNIRHGDIWRYISTTPEMHEFVRSPSREGLMIAMKRHKMIIKEQKSGQDEFYIAAMFLKRLINNGHLRFSSFVSLMIIMQTLIPRFNRSIFNPDIWVSSIPTYYGIRLAGRASTTLSFLRKGGLGGHYMIFPNHIMTCIVDRPLKGRSFYDAERFARSIENALHDILRLPKNVE